MPTSLGQIFTILREEYCIWGKANYQKLDLLIPGNDKAIDMVCERIIDGDDFVMDEDMVKFYANFKCVHSCSHIEIF